MNDHAVARATDPDTSWEAARSFDTATLRANQRVVLGYLLAFGPMTDDQLVARMAGQQSPSGTRTRRSELVAKGLVYDTGQRVVLGSGRRAIVWAAIGVAATVPPAADPAKPALEQIEAGL